MCNIQFRVFNVQYSVWSMQGSVICVKCVTCSIQCEIHYVLSLAFRAGTAKTFSLTDSDERKNLNLHSRVENPLLFSWNQVLKQYLFLFTLNRCISETVIAFDLILKLRARPEYQQSSGNKCPHVSLLYLVWLIFLSSSTTVGYAQLLWLGINHFFVNSESL